MNRLGRSIFVFVVATGVTVRAQSSDTARIALDSAERQLTGATHDAIAARRELDYALTNQRQAADAARNASMSLDQMRLVLDDPAAVDRALNNARGAARVVGERDEVLRQAQSRLDASAVTVEDYRAQRRANFEASPAFAQGSQLLQAAQNRVEALTDGSLWVLENDPEYQQLAALAAMTRTRIQFLRDREGVDPQALARASQAWLDAENAANVYQQWWLENDVLINSAKAAEAREQRQFDLLRGRFEAELAGDPRHLELIAMRDAEQRAVAAAAAQLQEARSLEQLAQADAVAMQQRLVLARQQYQQIQTELASTYTELDTAAASVGHADRRLRDVLDARDRAAMERDRAFRDFRRAQDDDGNRFRDERDRIVRDRDTTNTSDAASVNRERDRGRRTLEFDDGRAPTIVIPPTPPGPPQMLPAPLPSPPPRAVPQERPRSEEPRPTEPRVPDSPPRDRTDDVIRRSSDSPADSTPPRITDEVRDRSPGSYRPAAGSNR